MDAIVQKRIQPLPDALVAELDEVDKVARRSAQRNGLSHVLAVGRAKRADGKLIGHVNT